MPWVNLFDESTGVTLDNVVAATSGGSGNTLCQPGSGSEPPTTVFSLVEGGAVLVDGEDLGEAGRGRIDGFLAHNLPPEFEGRRFRIRVVECDIGPTAHYPYGETGVSGFAAFTAQFFEGLGCYADENRGLLGASTADSIDGKSTVEVDGDGKIEAIDTGDGELVPSGMGDATMGPGLAIGMWFGVPAEPGGA